MSRLVVRGLAAAYGSRRVLHDVDLDVPTGELHAVLGPSGCGKSTLLRCIAGLKTPERGTVLLDDADVTRAPPHRRGIVLLHQENALFPHLDVERNVGFAPAVARLDDRERAARVAAALDLVGLSDRRRSRADHLSGGERQRVALARAVAARPKILLLDEPLSHLDEPLRLALRRDVRRILKHQGITTLLVTHDREDALATADRVVLLDGGRVVDHGIPTRIHDAPASPAAARLMGRRNLVDFAQTAPGHYSTKVGSFQAPEGAPERGVALLREEELSLAPTGPGTTVHVEAIEYVGGRYLILCTSVGVPVWVEQADATGLRVGEGARLSLARAKPLVWPT